MVLKEHSNWVWIPSFFINLFYLIRLLFCQLTLYVIPTAARDKFDSPFVFLWNFFLQIQQTTSFELHTNSPVLGVVARWIICLNAERWVFIYVSIIIFYLFSSIFKFYACQDVLSLNQYCQRHESVLMSINALLTTRWRCRPWIWSFHLKLLLLAWESNRHRPLYFRYSEVLGREGKRREGNNRFIWNVLLRG